MLGFAGNAAARTDRRPKGRHQSELPLRLHGQLFFGAEGRRGGLQCLKKSRQPVARLPAGGEGDHPAGPAATCRDGRATSAASRGGRPGCSPATAPATPHLRLLRRRGGRTHRRDTGSGATAAPAPTPGRQSPPQAPAPPPPAAKSAARCLRPTTRCAGRPASRGRCPPGTGPDAGTELLPGRVQCLLLRRLGCRWWTRHPVLEANAASLSPGCQTALADLGR